MRKPSIGDNGEGIPTLYIKKYSTQALQQKTVVWV